MALPTLIQVDGLNARLMSFDYVVRGGRGKLLVSYAADFVDLSQVELDELRAQAQAAIEAYAADLGVGVQQSSYVELTEAPEIDLADYDIHYGGETLYDDDEEDELRF